MKIGKTCLIVMLLFMSLFLMANVPRVKASGTIYIKADGSIIPPTAPISTVDNITYTFTGDISDMIVIERDNIVVDGAGFTVQGTGTGEGIDLSYRSNVTVKNAKVTYFANGFVMWSSSNCTLVDNTASNHITGIDMESGSHNVLSNNNVLNNSRYSAMGIFMYDSSNNVLSGNNVSNNAIEGINLYDSEYNILYNNNVSNNEDGIDLDGSSNNILSENNITNNRGVLGGGISIWFSSDDNTISGNNIENNWEFGIRLGYSYNNTFYHNNLIGNTKQVSSEQGSQNIWDDGYPSGGNYWSDCTSTDLYSGPYQNETGSDGICDTPYVIDLDNVDHYPIMKYTLTINSTVGGTTNPASGLYNYPVGVTISVTAIAGTYYVFDHWELDSVNVSSTNPIDVLMNENHTLQPVFLEHHDVAVINLTTSPTYLSTRQLIYINVTVGNRGNFTESFSVSLNYTHLRDPLIGTQNVTDLLPDENRTLTFEWTTDLGGRYELRGEAMLSDDIDQTNNNLIIVVRVAPLGSGSYSGELAWASLFALFASVMTVTELRKREPKTDIRDIPAAVLKQNLPNNSTNLCNQWNRPNQW